MTAKYQSDLTERDRAIRCLITAISRAFAGGHALEQIGYPDAATVVLQAAKALEAALDTISYKFTPEGEIIR